MTYNAPWSEGLTKLGAIARECKNANGVVIDKPRYEQTIKDIDNYMDVVRLKYPDHFHTPLDASIIDAKPWHIASRIIGG
jgi:hypothetical protein